jgi:hypothetical protein
VVSASPDRAAWHVAGWGTLGWIETGIKSVAFLCAYAALATSITTGWSIPRGVRVAEFVLIGVATLGLLAAIGDRLLEREVVSMVFVVFNDVAHLALLASLVTTAGPGRLLTAFTVLMTCGELVKIRFLRSTGFTVRNTPTSVVIGLTAAYALLYATAAAVWVWR